MKTINVQVKGANQFEQYSVKMVVNGNTKDHGDFWQNDSSGDNWLFFGGADADFKILSVKPDDIVQVTLRDFETEIYSIANERDDCQSLIETLAIPYYEG